MPPFFLAKPERWILRPTRTLEPRMLHTLAINLENWWMGEIGEIQNGSRRFRKFLKVFHSHYLIG